MTQPKPIIISPGEMAQVMLGLKTRAIAKVKPPERITDRVTFRCQMGDKRTGYKIYDYTVIVDAHTKVKAKREYTGQALIEMGYPSHAARVPSDAPQTSREQYAAYRELYAALAFLGPAQRWTPKSTYMARDLSRDDRWLEEISFHRAGRADDLSRGEAAKIIQQMRAAEKPLLDELMKTRAFLYHDITLIRRYGLATTMPMQRAVLQLDHRQIRDIETIHGLFKTAHEPLRLRTTQNDHTTPPLPTDAFPDGKGHAQLLGGVSDTISLGTANLLVMGLVRHVLLNNPPPGSDDRTSNYAPPIAMRLSAEGNTTDTGYTNHRVDLPMTLDMMSVRTFEIPYRPANQYTRQDDVMAQEYGFGTMAALRQEMGIKPGETRTVYSYRANLTPPEELPFNRDRTGVRLRDMVRSLHDAWEEGNDPTVRRAKQFYDTLPLAAQREGDGRLLAYDDGSETNRKGTGPLPADVRAQRLHAPSLTVKAQAKPKRENAEATQRYPLQGDRWQVSRKGKETQVARASLQDQLSDDMRAQFTQQPNSEPPTTWQATISRGKETPQPAAANGNRPRLSAVERVALKADREAQRQHTRHSKHRTFEDLCREVEPLPPPVPEKEKPVTRAEDVHYGHFVKAGKQSLLHRSTHYETPEDYLNCKPTKQFGPGK